MTVRYYVNTFKKEFEDLDYATYLKERKTNSAKDDEKKTRFKNDKKYPRIILK